MKLSIITICFNDYCGLIKTARSVVAQVNKDFEWIVIDGGSTDGSINVLKDYSRYISFWVSETDKGIYNAMNKGVEHAKGDYCLFLNSGDQFCSSKSLLRVFRRDWYADIISCDMFLGGNRWNAGFANAPRYVGFLRIAKRNISHQATFIRTSLLKKIKYREDYRIVSDWAFWFQTLICNNYSYQNINIPITVFDIQGVSSIPNPLHREERRDFLKQFISPVITDKVLDEFSIVRSIDSAYMMTSQRTLLHILFNVVDWFYSKIIYRVSIRYKCLRYREW